MQELMEWIYTTLNSISPTYYNELERDEEGKAIINDITIVYDTPNILSLTDNKARLDSNLIIDIWAKKEQELEVLEKISLIDSFLNNEIVKINGLIFLFRKSNTWQLNVQDEDKNIIRKQLQYVVKILK